MISLNLEATFIFNDTLSHSIQFIVRLVIKDLSAFPSLIDYKFFSSGNIPLHLLITHVPVWALSIGHHFPHQYAKAPHITD